MPRLERQIFVGALGAILVAAGVFVVVSFMLVKPQSDEDTSYGLTTPKPKNAAVDVIDGYKSIKVGVTGEELKRRLKRPSWAMQEPILTAPVDGFYEISEMLPEEREWAGMQISEVELYFQKGFLVDIELRPAESKDFWDFQTAFQQKFGSPTSTSGGLTEWEGNNTEITFGHRPSPYIKITRKSVLDRVRAVDDQKRQREEEEQARHAEEMKKKLDAEKP